MTKDYQGRRLSRLSRSQQTPLLVAIEQPQNYHSISPRSSQLENDRDNGEGADAEQHEESEEEAHNVWFGKRIWRSFQEWERNHLELVLENKQSVARDHLGLRVS